LRLCLSQKSCRFSGSEHHEGALSIDQKPGVFTGLFCFVPKQIRYWLYHIDYFYQLMRMWIVYAFSLLMNMDLRKI
tara:strand:+ start:2553 stop:2780 length:228 start_codon:yes stop_codon:yes gene_type:complete